MMDSLKAELFSAFLPKGCDLLAYLRSEMVLESGTAYLDFTASGLAYREIERRIAATLPYYANTHSEVTRHALLMGELYELARTHLKEALGLDENFALFPAGNGATGAVKKFQELLGIYLPPRTKKRLGSAFNASAFPLVIVGPYEHHSNEISYRETPCEMVRLPLDSRGFFDLKALETELKKHHGREIIGAFSFASNATGILTPLKEISALMREHGGILALDMASASAYMNAPCELFDAAFYSPHKLLGGVGSCGVLAMRRELIDSSISPTFGGGGSITYVSRVDHYYREDLETREDAGTPNVFALIRAALAYRLRNEIGLEWIAKQKSELCRWLLGALSEIDGVQIYGDRECSQKMGIIALNLEGISPYEVTKRLSHEYLIETRAGCNCAGPYGHDLLGLKDDGRFPTRPGWVRISIHYTHTQEELERLVRALKEIATRGN